MTPTSVRAAPAGAAALVVGAALLAIAHGAAASPLTRGLDHLAARQQAATGAVGPTGAGQAADTAWAAIAVASGREAPAHWRSGSATLADAVEGLPASGLGDLQRLALARRACGVVDVDLADRIAAQQGDDGSFPGGASATAWGVLALRAAGRSAADPAVASAVAALVARRGADGGWAATDALESDVVTTATVLQALAAARMRATEPVIVAARARLLALRDPRGGFGGSVPTAWAVLAIRALGERPQAAPWAAGGGPLAILTDLQGADGGVRVAPGKGESLFATSLAVLAWSGRTLPVAPGARPTMDRVPTITRRTPSSGDTVRGVLSVHYRDELGGTGIDPGGVRLWLNGINWTSRARITPYTLQVRASRLPAGALGVKVRVRDLAGNTRVMEWSVTGPVRVDPIR